MTRLIRVGNTSPNAVSGLSDPALGVAIGALFVATSGVWVRLSGTSPGTASVYRCTLALPFLALLAMWTRGKSSEMILIDCR